MTAYGKVQKFAPRDRFIAQRRDEREGGVVIIKPLSRQASRGSDLKRQGRVMPLVELANIRLYYEEHGRSPALVLAQGNACGVRSWDPQLRVSRIITA
jgi:hypothetical protein